jgi:hypothetical protein
MGCLSAWIYPQGVEDRLTRKKVLHRKMELTGRTAGKIERSAEAFQEES